MKFLGQSFPRSAQPRNDRVNSDHEQVAAALPCSSAWSLTLVEKQNSHYRVTLKFVKYLYFSALECGFA
jgi:hypothetical protein